MRETGWQQNSVRGFSAGADRDHAGLLGIGARPRRFALPALSWGFGGLTPVRRRSVRLLGRFRLATTLPAAAPVDAARDWTAIFAADGPFRCPESGAPLGS